MIRMLNRTALLAAAVTASLAPLDALEHPGSEAPVGEALQPSELALPAQVAPSPLLERVAVIGASVSSGSGMLYEIGAHASLVPTLQAAIAPGAWPEGSKAPHDGGMFAMFTNPSTFGPIQVQSALQTEPTLVIALDFLFWYAHGFMRDEWRMTKLEEGLAVLDRFQCPMLVGDLPGIEFALDGKSRLTGGPLVWSGMLPNAEIRAKLNARIHAWAAEREHVTVAPMASFVEEAYAGPDFAELIQEDMLHPTVKGALTLLLQSLEKLVEARPELDRSHIVWDIDAAKALVFERTAAARAKAEARKARVDALLGR